MLKSLYVNNYKSLVNFKIEFNRLNLLIGQSGTGKSSVFEVLFNLRLLIVGKANLEAIFQAKTLTRWQTSPVQTFEFELDDYRYQLKVEHNLEHKQQKVQQEKLLYKDQILLDFQDGRVQLFRDDGALDSQYPFDWGQSAVASLPERLDNQLLTKFKHQLAHLLILHPIAIPELMPAFSQTEAQLPTYYGENFVAWYRYLMQEGTFTFELTQHLRFSLPDFEALALEVTGRDERRLVVKFKAKESRQAYSFGFDELSNGQRMLIVLYTLLHLVHHPLNEDYRVMLCLDEPENFLVLREIEPWLQVIYDYCQENLLQVLLISHHPKSIDYLLMPSHQPVGFWFEREGNLEATRITTIDTMAQDFPISELIARGWFDGE